MNARTDVQTNGQTDCWMNEWMKDPHEERNGVQVLMMLHEDEEYQRDVGDAQAMDAILMDVKQHPEKLQK